MAYYFDFVGEVQMFLLGFWHLPLTLLIDYELTSHVVHQLTSLFACHLTSTCDYRLTSLLVQFLISLIFYHLTSQDVLHLTSLRVRHLTSLVHQWKLHLLRHRCQSVTRHQYFPLHQQDHVVHLRHRCRGVISDRDTTYTATILWCAACGEVLGICLYWRHWEPL